MKGGADDTRAGKKIIIEPANVPVGVCEKETVVIEMRLDLCRHESATVRPAQNHWSIALNDFNGIHVAKSGRVTPADIATTLIGPAPCGTTTIKPMRVVNYTLTAADIAGGAAQFKLSANIGDALAQINQSVPHALFRPDAVDLRRLIRPGRRIKTPPVVFDHQLKTRRAR